MWDTKIGRAIARHFTTHEDDHALALRCRRCGSSWMMPGRSPLVYVLSEAIHHLQHVHGLPGAVGAWQGYLDALPDPENPACVS